jgi:DNA-binding IclR family transcriptional regulator
MTASSTPATTTPKVPSVIGKVDRILSAFGADRPVLGLSELSRRTGLAKPTTYRVACSLVEVGLLDTNEQGFTLGSRLFELGQLVPRYRDISRAAMPFVEDLYVATNATVYLAIRDGQEMLYVLKIRGHKGENQVSSVAGRMPVHCTATGRAILAAEPDEVLEACIAAGLPPLTRHTNVSPAALREIIAQARAAGAGVEHEEVRLGYGAAAAPVIDRTGRALAAIGVAQPTLWGRPESLCSLVRTSAMALSRSLHPAPALGGPVGQDR